MRGHAVWAFVGFLLSAVIATVPTQPRAQAPPQTDTTPCDNKKLCIGVRSYARPFSYKPEAKREIATDGTFGPLAKLGYTGYIVRICDAVLKEMTLDVGDGSEHLKYTDIGVFDVDVYNSDVDLYNSDVDLYNSDVDLYNSDVDLYNSDVDLYNSDVDLYNSDVDLYNSTEGASTTADGPRFNGMGQKFDILCDPATISNERRSGLTVSSPLFLTGISYITPPQEPIPRNACANDLSLIGIVRGTNAATHGLKTLIKAHELPQFEKELTDYLKGMKPCEDNNPSVEDNNPSVEDNNPSVEDNKPSVEDNNPSVEDNKPNKPLVWDYINHKKAAEAFCKNEIFYYVGDLEVITENARANPGCDYENGSQTYTTDRYAIFGKPITDSNPLERRLRVARFFEILGRKTVFTPSILDDAFKSTFYGMQPSEKLDVFYQSIRGIPEQR